MKRKNRVDAARSKFAPVAETLAATATEKIVPLAHTTADRVVPFAQNVAARAIPIATGAAAAAGPLAHQAYGKAALAVGATAAAGPLVHQMYEKAAPLAGQAVDAVSPYTHAVADKVSPYTEMAAVRIAPVLAGGAAAAHGAAERVGPALESARDRVSDELLPKVTTALSAAAASPLAVEAVKRGRATAAAARGELSLPEPAPKRGGWVKRIALVAALAGVAAVVVRKFLGGNQDSGWQAARPSTPAPAPAPTPTPAPFSAAAASVAPADPEAAATESVDEPAGTDADVNDVAVDLEAPEAEDATDSRFGEGSYVGSEPPEGFFIKGNENSMKYHLPDGGGYEQTVAEVWFNSEEAAERAGFNRAQG